MDAQLAQEPAIDPPVMICNQCGFLTARRYSTCHVCAGGMRRVQTPEGGGDAREDLFAQITFDPDRGVVEAGRQEGAAAADRSPGLPAQARPLFEEAVALRAAGDLRQALGKLRAAHEVAPDDDEVRRVLDEVALAYARAKADRTQRTLAYNWPMFRGNIARTGFTPEVVVPPLSQRWQFQAGEWALASPAVANAVAYVGARAPRRGRYGRLCAVDWRGELMWDAYVSYEVNSSPAVVGGRRIILGLDRRIACVRADTAQRIWDYPTADVVSGPPAVWHDTVYCPSTDGSLYALRLDNGRSHWSFRTDAPIVGGPTVWQDVVFIGSCDHAVYALDAAQGELLWQFMTGDEVVATPAYSGGDLFVGSLDGRLYCLHAATGAKRWEHRAGGPIDSSPALADGVVYFGSRDRHIHAVDASTGALLWAFETGDWVQSSPVVSGDILYCGSHDRRVYGIERETGTAVWEWELGGEVRSSPAISGGALFVSCNDGCLYCFVQR